MFDTLMKINKDIFWSSLDVIFQFFYQKYYSDWNQSIEKFENVTHPLLKKNQLKRNHHRQNDSQVVITWLHKQQ